LLPFDGGGDFVIRQQPDVNRPLPAFIQDDLRSRMVFLYGRGKLGGAGVGVVKDEIGHQNSDHDRHPKKPLVP
jgi:hypothetical protein